MQQPAVADTKAVEARPSCVRSVLTEDRDAHVHQTLIEIRRADVPALHGAGAEVLADDVGRRAQAAEQVLALGDAQVARHALPAPALHGPEQRVAVDEGPDGAHEVATAWVLDLDDLGPLLAEDAGAEGGGDAGAHVDDADAFERQAHLSMRKAGRPRRARRTLPSWSPSACGPPTPTARSRCC